MEIKFKIVTPERTVFEDEVRQATIPTTDGEITILPNHRSYIASLAPGEIMFKKDNAEFLMSTSGGFIEFNNNELVVLADTAERAEEIGDVKTVAQVQVVQDGNRRGPALSPLLQLVVQQSFKGEQRPGDDGVVKALGQLFISGVLAQNDNCGGPVG